MDLVLRELNAGDEAAFLEAFHAFQDPKFIFALEYDPKLPFADYVRKLDKMKKGVDLPADRVPASLYFGFVGKTIVGRMSFRHILNDWLFKHAGHLGYGVVPRYRGQGYAQAMLREVLPKVREQGVMDVLITPINGASQRVVEACGGKPEALAQDADPGANGLRYWIHLGRA